jgi:hypothetical protein
MKKEESFIVGEIFQHRNKNLMPIFFGENAINFLLVPAKTRVIFIRDFLKNKLKYYVLPKDMNANEIKNVIISNPMEENNFWIILFFVKNPEIGKKFLKYEIRKDKVYIFHIKLASGNIVILSLSWGDYEWYVYFCEMSAFPSGSIHLYF